jgi:hypothetical protein
MADIIKVVAPRVVGGVLAWFCKVLKTIAAATTRREQAEGAMGVFGSLHRNKPG